jgi:hypothetical protein
MIALYTYTVNFYCVHVLFCVLQSFATGIVEETHEQWKKLINGGGTGSLSW